MSGAPASVVARLCILLLLAVLALPACRRGPGPVDPSYLAEIEGWRAQRIERLTAPDGWLTLVGLSWLEPGDNRFGADPDNEVVLAGDGIPRLAGTIELGEAGQLVASAAPGVAVTIDGEPLGVGHELRTDDEGHHDVLGLGRLRFYVIARGDRFAVRVKDPEAGTRRHFEGIDAYPVDPAFRVDARLEPFAEPREVAIPTAVGTEETMQASGLLRFELRGRDMTLLPFAEEDGSLFLVFSDLTSGDTTYGAGRFLAVAPPSDGGVVLDFNRAYNPPCAFTPFATCPLPPPENRLQVRIEAGEKYRGAAH